MDIIKNDAVVSSVGPTHSPRLDITVTNERFNEFPSLTKVIKTGNFFETYDYQIPVTVGKRRKIKKIERKKNPIREEEYKKRKAQRIKGSVSRLVQGNFSENSKFVTLTFGDNDFDIFNLKEANKKFHLFIIKLRNLYPKLKYLAVPEFQKRGAVHYHMVYNLPFINKEKLAKIWSYGFVQINEVYRIYGIGCYFTKYLTKNCQDERLSKNRSYFCSRNLIRPKIFYGVEAREFIDSFKDKLVAIYDNSYPTKFNGQTNYKKYYFDSKIGGL